MTPTNSTIPIEVTFTGGLELIFSNNKHLSLSLPLDPTPTVSTLVTHLTAKYLATSPTSKRELFILDDAVRPGILVLVNDADWELLGEADAPLASGDEVVFVSTLHGG